MKISTELYSVALKVGEEKGVELIARAGFDHWDFSMFDMFRYDKSTKEYLSKGHILSTDDYLKFARKLKQIGLDNGITCNQSHAPFPIMDKRAIPFFKRALECTAEAGGKICVIHPNNDWTPEQNAETYLELLPFAKQCGVKMATENMWNWDAVKDEALPAACSSHQNFRAHVDAVNDDYLIACVDIGHAEMRGLHTNAVDMIKLLGDKVQAIHIHDNDKWQDSHQIPYSMDIDFKAVVRALKDVNYKGEFTLECGEYLTPYTAENVLFGLEDMAKAVRKMADEFESLK